jgi:hypothetical protein
MDGASPIIFGILKEGAEAGLAPEFVPELFMLILHWDRVLVVLGLRLMTTGSSAPPCARTVGPIDIT